MSDPTMESLRVSPEEFSKVVDRSSGGPTYRKIIKILCAMVTFIALVSVISAIVTLISLAKFSTVIERLDESEKEAKSQRELLLAQNKIFIECTTPSPPPGIKLPDNEDGVHECYDAGEAKTGGVLSLVIQAQIKVAECVREKAPDLSVCVTNKPRG